MDPIEEAVIGDLERRGFECRRFSKRELRAGKTPDCRVYRDGAFSFYLEIKEVASSHWLGGARPDPVFNRLTDDIHTAVKQFDAVNPDHDEPNVLAIVNNDQACGSLDLIGVVTGHAMLQGGGTAPIYQSFSEGRIRDEKRRVDLFLWYDSRKSDQLFFTMFEKRHFAKLCLLFEIDPGSVPTLGA